MVVDDDPAVQEMIKRALRPRGWHAAPARTGREAVERVKSEPFDLVLLDLHLPDVDGLVVLQLLREFDPDLAVLILTGHGDLATAVEAMRLGAENFLAKPFDVHHLQESVARALETVRLRRVNRYMAERAAGSHRLAELGRGPLMEEVARELDQVAATPATLLIQGETGTGKGWVAELVHALSLRPRGPFVALNCAALTPASLDVELFGQEGRGDASRGMQRGLLEMAHGGTLFLDEIGELAPELQPRLLSVLQNGRFRRVGGSREVEVDVRVLAATRHDLAALVRAGRFREDLYYRVAVHPVRLPPLRERGREAVADLAYRVLEQLRQTLGRGPARISHEALERLVSHPWPGNVRELRNVLERAILNAPDGTELLLRHLPRDLPSAPRDAETAGPTRDLAAVMAVTERRHIARVLAELGGNRSAAARELGVSRATLYEKMKRHGLDA